MKSRSILASVVAVAVVSLLAGLAPFRPAAAPERYNVDPVHSTALFRVHHLGAGMFWGRFNDLSGTVEFDPESGEGLKFDVAIKIASVDTANENLNTHLKSPDFFDAESHPEMRFASTSVKKTGERTYAVNGNLTIRDVTKPITVEMEWTGTNEGGRMGKRSGFETTFTIKRSEFGVMYGVQQGMLGDETRIVVAIEGVRQTTDDGGS